VDDLAKLIPDPQKQGDFMRVLVVEDEPDLLSVLAQSLREDGYAVDTAEDGREGFLKVKGRARFSGGVVNMA
jgi:CheY-like chemotaxis protein